MNWHVERFWHASYEQWEYQAFQAAHYGRLACERCGNTQDGDFWGARCLNCSAWIKSDAVERVNKPIGRCWVMAIPGAPAHLSGLEVAPAWRGQGIARALLEQVLADYAETGVVGHAEPFGVARGLSRRALIAFYRRHGASVSRTAHCTWRPHNANTPKPEEDTRDVRR